MRSWLSVLITDAESKKVFDIPIAPSLYSLSNKMDNSLLAVRDINHKYIVVESVSALLRNYVIIVDNTTRACLKNDSGTFGRIFISNMLQVNEVIPEK
jgi:hypothetical protein